jgi:ABC-type multidrug transport system permease subunit
VVGLLVGRWWVLIFPIVLWCGLTIFLIANNGWYGYGWGDNGIALNIVAAILSVVLTAVGVAVRSVARKGRRRGATEAATPH